MRSAVERPFERNDRNHNDRPHIDRQYHGHQDRQHIDRPHIDRPYDRNIPDRPHQDRPHQDRPHIDRPYDRNIADRPHQDRPHIDRPHIDRSYNERPYDRNRLDRPHVDRPYNDRPYVDRQMVDRPHIERPYNDRNHDRSNYDRGTGMGYGGYPPKDYDGYNSRNARYKPSDRSPQRYPPRDVRYDRDSYYPPGDRQYYDQDRRYQRNRAGPYERNYQRPQVDYKQDYRTTGPIRRGQSILHSTSVSKIYVGNMTTDITEEQLTQGFAKFGQILKVEYKQKFAFVDYARVKDADTAIREMNGRIFFGSKLRVQPHTDHKKMNYMREPNLAAQGTIINLDDSVSWQDLKDFARQAGDVIYASVVVKDQKRYGMIEFASEEILKNAVSVLSGKKVGENRVQIIAVPLTSYLKTIQADGTSQLTGGPNQEENRYDLDTYEAEEPADEVQKDSELYNDNQLDSVDYD